MKNTQREISPCFSLWESFIAQILLKIVCDRHKLAVFYL